MKTFEQEFLEIQKNKVNNIYKSFNEDSIEIIKAEGMNLDIFKSWSTDLMRQFPGGRWITTSGAKVFINAGGKVVAGLKGFNEHIDKFFEGKKKEGGNFKGKTKSGKEYDLRKPISHEDYKDFNSEDHKEVAKKHSEMVGKTGSEQSAYHASQSTLHKEKSGDEKKKWEMPVNTSQKEWVKIRKEMDSLVPPRGGDWSKRIENYKKDHEELIKQALKEGKNVPDEVLKDYPDLKKEQKPGKTKEALDKLGVKEEKISEIERSFIKNAKSKYPEIDEKTVIDYANKIAKYDKEDRKVEHVAEAVNYASSNPKTHFDIGEFSIKRAIDGKHTGHPQAERVIDIGIGGELGKKAKEVNDKFKNIQYKTKNLSNEGKQMLKVASEKLELDLDKLNKMINELQGNKPEDVAEVINRVGFASGEPMPKKTKELPIGKQSDKEFLSGKWQYGGSRKDIVDRWTNESLDKIGEGKQFKTKEDAIKEIRKMAKTRKEIDRHEEARILNIVADRIDKLEKPSKPSVKKQAEKHEDDLPF